MTRNSGFNPTQAQANDFFQNFAASLADITPENIQNSTSPLNAYILADNRFGVLMDKYFDDIPYPARTQHMMDLRDHIDTLRQAASDQLPRPPLQLNQYTMGMVDTFYNSIAQGTPQYDFADGVDDILSRTGRVPTSMAGESPIVLPPVQQSPVTPSQTGHTDHTVEGGDNLWDLVKEHYDLEDPRDIKRTVEHVAHYNEKHGIDANRLQIGETVKFPNSPAAPEGTPALDWAALDADSRRLKSRFDHAGSDTIPVTAPQDFTPPPATTDIIVNPGLTVSTQPTFA